MNWRAERRKRSAFTLVELAAVIVITALLAVGALLSLRGNLAAAKLGSVMSRIQAFEQQARAEAKRQSLPVLLRFEVGSDRLEQWTAGRRQPRRTIYLGPAFKIEAVRTRWQNGGSAGRVVVSPLGQSVDYGLKLEGEDEQIKWLFVSGLSGQTVWMDSDAEFESLWRASPLRTNAR